LKSKVTKKSKTKKFLILSIIIIIIICILIIIQYKNKVLPSVLEISKKYAVDTINEKINSSVEEIITKMNLTSKDFFEKEFDSEEKINYFSVDTMLINRVCSNTAAEISKRIKNSEDEKIKLPIGIFSGLDILTNIGPKFTISIILAGNTLVDYETAFESQGINQVNFKIWLVTTTDVSIINPFYTKEISVKRKLMLVNTVFNGSVPQTYLNMPNNNTP